MSLGPVLWWGQVELRMFLPVMGSNLLEGQPATVLF